MIKNNQKKQTAWFQYFFLISIFALTGFEYFFRANLLMFPIFILAGIFFVYKKCRLKGEIFLLIFPFVFISLIQSILEYNQNIFTTILLFISFLTYYFIAKLVNVKFAEIFIKSVFILSVISLIFFLLTYSGAFMSFISSKVSPYFAPIGNSGNVDALAAARGDKNILIYNFKDYGALYNRNSGPFWEPGMFTIFVNIALYLNLMFTRRLFDIKNIIFLITIITTLSTTGYIAVIFTLFVYSLFYSKSKLNIVYLVFLVAGTIYIANLNFMKSKVLEQINNSHHNASSRFGASVVHYQVISEHPITGVGDGASRFIADLTDADSTANGLTFVFVKYGVFLGILYYALLLYSCINTMKYYLNKKFLGYVYFILLLILAFSQDITVRHFYLFLIVWGVVVINPRIGLKKYKLNHYKLDNAG